MLLHFFSRNDIILSTRSTAWVKNGVLCQDFFPCFSGMNSKTKRSRRKFHFRAHKRHPGSNSFAGCQRVSALLAAMKISVAKQAFGKISVPSTMRLWSHLFKMREDVRYRRRILGRVIDVWVSASLGHNRRELLCPESVCGNCDF